MAESSRVLVDSSLWIDFLAGDETALRALASLRRDHAIVICGQILQEVLQGSRDAQAFAKLQREFAIWDREAEQPDDFLEAARTYARLRWKGITVPPADCVIAAVARRCDLALCATDPHFDEIPGLRRYRLA